MGMAAHWRSQCGAGSCRTWQEDVRPAARPAHPDAKAARPEARPSAPTPPPQPAPNRAAGGRRSAP